MVGFVEQLSTIKKGKWKSKIKVIFWEKKEFDIIEPEKTSLYRNLTI